MAAGTKDKLIDTALRLFREHGYEHTTMRKIAAEAEVSLGNAYYYFSGKDDFVQELYRRIQIEHHAKATPLVADGATLQDNVGKVLHAGLDVMAPYHSFGTAFLSTALPAESRSSPFGPESQSARTMAIGLMANVVTASKPKIRGELAAELPQLLWMAYMGVTLRWTQDQSENQCETRRFVDQLVPVLAKAVALSRLPVARGLVHDIVALLPSTGGPMPADEEDQEARP